MMKDKITGGFYGLLTGDALGVPYEFYKADQLPPYEDIEMVPRRVFAKRIPVWKREPGRTTEPRHSA